MAGLNTSPPLMLGREWVRATQAGDTRVLVEAGGPADIEVMPNMALPSDTARGITFRPGERYREDNLDGATVWLRSASSLSDARASVVTPSNWTDALAALAIPVSISRALDPLAGTLLLDLPDPIKGERRRIVPNDGRLVFTPAGDIVRGATAMADGAAKFRIVQERGPDTVSLDLVLYIGAASIPAGLGFDLGTFPIVLSLDDPGGDAPATGVVNITPEALFDRFSTARSAPANTYYFGAGGADANPGTPASKKLSLSGCILAGNATGQPYKVVPDSAEYFRNVGAMSVQPTQDIAIVPAGGGRMVSGVFDTFAAALDGTYASCYVVTIGGVDRVVNRTAQNAYGSNRDFAFYASAAALNAANLTGDGYAYEGGKLYMRRLDGAQPTPANTRVNRSAVPFFRITADVSVYLENIDGEGGQIGVVEYTRSALSPTKRVFVAKNCTAKYGGGQVHPQGRGFSIDGINGLAFLFSSTANANATDGINGHDAIGNGTNILTVNCVGNDNGRGTAASCNGYTMHEGVKAMDAGGQYLNNRGGSVRHVNDAKVYHLGTMSSDLGDLANPGSNAAFQADGGGTAEIWCDRTKAPNAAGKNAYLNSGSSRIYKRHVAATLGASGGSGIQAFY